MINLGREKQKVFHLLIIAPRIPTPRIETLHKNKASLVAVTFVKLYLKYTDN
jgi:hypothetical protein